MSAAGRRLDTLAIHAGQERDFISGAVMTSIVLACTFAQEHGVAFGSGCTATSGGLEDVEDLKEDLERGFRAMEAAL